MRLLGGCAPRAARISAAIRTAAGRQFPGGANADGIRPSLSPRRGWCGGTESPRARRLARVGGVFLAQLPRLPLGTRHRRRRRRSTADPYARTGYRPTSELPLSRRSGRACAASLLPSASGALALLLSLGTAARGGALTHLGGSRRWRPPLHAGHPPFGSRLLACYFVSCRGARHQS